jgi:hypothetical protein
MTVFSFNVVVALLILWRPLMHVLPREIDHGRTRVHLKSGVRIFRTEVEKLHLPRSFAVCVLLLLVFETSVLAVDPTRHISQYAHTAWRIQDAGL